MAKSIEKKTKKNARKIARRLDSELVTISLRAMPSQTMTAGEALLWGEQLFVERKVAHVVRLADQLAVRYGDVIDVHLLKMRALLQLECLEEVIPIINKYLELAADNIRVLLCAVQLNIILGDFDLAERYLTTANRCSPNNVDILLQAATFYRFSGQRGKARKMLLRCLSLSEKRGTGTQIDLELYAMVLSSLALNGGVSEQQHQNLRALSEASALNGSLKSQCFYGAAAVEYSNKDICGEIEYLKKANQYEAEWLGHDISAKTYQEICQEKFENQKVLFSHPSPDWLKEVSRSDKAAPIFILGMYRSGTTLIEQMLGSHSRLGQTGESKAMVIGIGSAYEKHNYAYTVDDYPKGISKLPLSTLNELADGYVNYQKVLTADEMYIDKEISNFKIVGLVANLFPRAKFIHMSRAPLDIILSCYKNSIPGSRSTTNLEHLALDYIAMKKLIGHWLNLYPERVMIVDYAKLVSDSENQVKKILEFLNLPFEAECMDFHGRENIVRTISTDQVKKGIYQSAIGKWKPYESMLQPAIKVFVSSGIPLEGVPYL